MRSALLCVFFALIVHNEGSLAEDEDFRPTPIPLNEWNGSSREDSTAAIGAGAGTLHEAIATDAPAAVAAVPAHYWEDALRHSVYLTLVRDKIDQLIAKSAIISPDTKPEHAPNEVDDHDLWEKIKSAPFDRLNNEEPAYLGDITIIAKGRLLEEKNGLRFTEDEMSKEKCNGANCTDDVKAYWSVKRVRQRDAETAPGKYHYELTFAVSSQTPKKQHKPYENPVRTFTVREGTPVERPQYRPHETAPYPPRPQRAVWFHKNIGATAPHQIRQPEEDIGLDRLFSSLFSLDDDPPAKRYKHVPYVPQMYPTRSKLGHVGSGTDQYNHKQLLPYSYKPQPQTPHKFGRPPIGPPPVPHLHSKHQYIDAESQRNQNQFTPPSTDYKYLSTNIVKSTKPAVLPTPPISYAPLNITMEMTHNFNLTESTTKEPEIITGFTMYSKPRPQPTKVSYFQEHVRPPVFNAPPGVFVTMDKKPFKPMPPLKYLHSHKPNKNKPIDFRPSPQVLDAQFSDPLSVPSTDAFRPITMGYNSASNNTNSSEMADDDIKVKPNRKSKPPKKHDNIKPHRTTTSVPEIITAYNEILDEMNWANILGAFAKTTPMVSQKMNLSETTTPLASITVSSTTTVPTSNISKSEITTTTIKPSKTRRTRPPPKFAKPMKVKKHKRLTSTSTTTTTTTTTTTEKPHHRRPAHDLQPQASSAATNATKSSWHSNSKTHNTTTSTTPLSANLTNDTVTTTTSQPPSSTTAKINPTTYRASTTTRQKTTTEAPSTTTVTTTTTVSIQSKNKNRFRQSTLMQKGTSVNHDKWSSPYIMEKNKTSVERTKLVYPLSSKFPRRKGSNFQGYMSTNRKIIDRERNKEDYIDHVSNPRLNVISLSTTSEATTQAVHSTTQKPTQETSKVSYEQNEHIEVDDINSFEELEDDSDDSEDTDDQNENPDEQDLKDQGEYIFDASSTNFSGTSDSYEIESGTATTTEETVTASQYSTPKNKTKCKKKKNQETNQVTAKSASVAENEISVTPIETTTEKLSTADFFGQIFGMTVDQNETNGNKSDSKYVDSDEDLEEFLDSINRKKDSSDSNDDEYEEEDRNDDDDNSPFNNDEDNRFPRNADGSYEDYQDRPFSFLELMAME